MVAQCEGPGFRPQDCPQPVHISSIQHDCPSHMLLCQPWSFAAVGPAEPSPCTAHLRCSVEAAWGVHEGLQSLMGHRHRGTAGSRRAWVLQDCALAQVVASCKAPRVRMRSPMCSCEVRPVFTLSFRPVSRPDRLGCGLGVPAWRVARSQCTHVPDCPVCWEPGPVPRRVPGALIRQHLCKEWSTWAWASAAFAGHAVFVLVTFGGLWFPS